MEMQVVTEFPPGQFLAEMDHILRRRLQATRRVPDAGRGDFAHRQMRRQERGRVDRGPVTVRLVAADRIVDEIVEPLARRSFARRPPLRKGRRPIRLVR